MKYICVERYLSVCVQQGVRRVTGFCSFEIYWLVKYPSSSAFSQLLVLCGESTGERRFTLPRGCFHSPLEVDRTSSALGMCADTHNPDHVMA